jgi:hypothetical protein
MTGELLEFDLTHAALVIVQPQNIQTIRASDTPGLLWGSKMTFPRKEVGISNSTNPDFIKNARQAISGIMIAQEEPRNLRRFKS